MTQRQRTQVTDALGRIQWRNGMLSVEELRALIAEASVEQPEILDPIRELKRFCDAILSLAQMKREDAEPSNFPAPAQI